MIERQTNIPLSLVVAMANNNGRLAKTVICPGGSPMILKWFKESHLRTNPLLWAARRIQSIRKALPGRDNIVITRRADFAAPEVTVASDLEDAISIAEAFAIAREASEICIIGGGEIYREALPLAATLYLTEVDTEVADADTYFPEVSPSEWVTEELGVISPDAKNDHAARILKLTRKPD